MLVLHEDSDDSSKHLRTWRFQSVIHTHNLYSLWRFLEFANGKLSGLHFSIQLAHLTLKKRYILSMIVEP